MHRFLVTGHANRSHLSKICFQKPLDIVKSLSVICFQRKVIIFGAYFHLILIAVIEFTKYRVSRLKTTCEKNDIPQNGISEALLLLPCDQSIIDCINSCNSLLT